MILKFSKIALAFTACLAVLTGCANQSTNATLNSMSQAIATAIQPAAGQGSWSPSIAPQKSPGEYKHFTDTPLPNIFAEARGDLNARKGYPKVALIPLYVPSFHQKQSNFTQAIDQRRGCWVFTAKIWRDAKKVEDVPAFSYCMPYDIQKKPRSSTVNRVDLEMSAEAHCFDSSMPTSYMSNEKNGTGPVASYRITPKDYLPRGQVTNGSEQLYFMLSDMGADPATSASACRVWVASSEWQNKDF